MAKADKKKKMDLSDLPVMPFKPLDCRKSQFAHLTTTENRKIITLSSPVRVRWEGHNDA